MKKLFNIFKNRIPENINRRIKSTTDDKPSLGRKRKYSLSLPWLPHLASAMILVITVMTMGWHFNKASIVEQVDVRGNFFTETSDILDLMAIREGTQADSLNFLEIMENVEKMPFVKQAFINRSPSGQVQLRVKEREPVVLLIESNRRTYVDAEGIRMPAIPGKSVDVPLLYATSTEMKADTLDGQIFATVNRFLRAAGKIPPAQTTISEIAWSDTEGVIALSHDKGYRLIFGNENFDNRIHKWMTFYTDKILNEGIHNMNSIDLRFEGQIVTR